MSSWFYPFEAYPKVDLMGPDGFCELLRSDYESRFNSNSAKLGIISRYLCFIFSYNNQLVTYRLVISSGFRLGHCLGIPSSSRLKSTEKCLII